MIEHGTPASAVRVLRWELAHGAAVSRADPETRMVFQRNLTRHLDGSCGAWAGIISSNRRRPVDDHDPHHEGDTL